MASLFTIPNEILNEIALYLRPGATANLLSTCRSLSSRLAPAMIQHDISPKTGLHALHWAANEGHLPLLRRLLLLFPVDFPDHNGHTALYYACRGWNMSEAVAETIVPFLLANGANIHGGATTTSSSVFAPLAAAFLAGWARVARILLDAGADPNCTSADGAAIILVPVKRGECEAMEMLLDYGADITGTGEDGTDPFMVAVEHGQLAVVHNLVTRGVDVRCVDSRGNTPLLQAIYFEHSDVAMYLAQLRGVDITSGSEAFDSPLHSAVQEGWHALVGVLIDQGCPVDGVDRLGRTAVQVAVAMGWGKIVGMVLAEEARRAVVDTMPSKD